MTAGGMNAERLLSLYERIADAPDAVGRLRGFVLDLAVRGKLVPQDSQDASAANLLTEGDSIRRVATNKYRGKARIASAISDAERPFHPPQSWMFVRLGEILEMTNGRAFKPTEWVPSGLPIVRIQNLNNRNAPFNYCDASTVAERHLIGDGEFLLSWSGTPGTSFGAFIWDRGTAALNQHIFRCKQLGCAFSPFFLRLAINSQLDVLIGLAQGGVGLQHVTKGTLEALLLPLPPLAEQHRIVAKVDELMALCDWLEAARAQREAARDKLAAASLARLNTPDPDPTTFAHHARFALDTLPALTTRPDQIKQLRQTILNLAVRGKLVAQDPRDEPAAALLKRITFESSRKRHAITSVEQDAEPYPVPKSWEWSALGYLITAGPQNGISPKATTRTEAPKAITLTATTSGTFNPIHFKHVEASIPKDSDFWLTDGDLLFQRGNTREYVGIAAIYQGRPNTFLFPDLIMRVRVSPCLDLRFIHLASVSPSARAFFSANASGAQATMPKINQATLVSLPIPLPPLAEQHRIVAKVDELMNLCDRLEANLGTADASRRRLLDALLHEALNPVSTERAAEAENA